MPWLSALATPQSNRLRALGAVVLALAFLSGVEAPPREVYPEGPLGSTEEEAPQESLGKTFDLLRGDRSRHLTRLGVDRWHDAGFRGQGIKVAVLDTGFRGYRSYLGKGLPGRVTVKSFRQDRNLEARDSQHGILCAEVLHSIAPQAEILLANWESDDPSSFLRAVEWAKDQGARVITCSVIMPSWSDGEGGGRVNAELGRILGNGRSGRDVLCFASAGNTALRHWSGSFHPDPAGYHQWEPGKNVNLLKPWGKERVAVQLYGPIGSSYNLQVHDAQTGTLVGKSPVRRPPVGNPSWGSAVVRFLPLPRRSYYVRLTCDPRSRPAAGERFHLVVLGGSLNCNNASGSIPFPGDGPGVQAVGAVNALGQRLAYSSCGPNTARPKPDFVALVPFVSACRPKPFAGTSAAAPQAAALAALVWSRNPEWTSERVAAALKTSAHDLGPAGHDWETGYGLVRLP